MWSFKYKNCRSLAQPFATLMYDKIFEDLSDTFMFHSFTELLIVPIPLHPKRKRQRGYNQSELIARELYLKDKTIFTLTLDVLYRSQHTTQQARIQNRSQRIRNVQGCFAVRNQHLIHKRTVLLIDDVSTTGATLAEAARVLKKAGAKHVHTYCVAH
jgi:competence protein ComFC